MNDIREALKRYAKAVRRDLAANPPAGGDGATVEPMLHDRFRTLVEDLLPLIFSKATTTLPNVSVEWRADSIGRPDIAFSRAGLARLYRTQGARQVHLASSGLQLDETPPCSY